MALAGRRGVSKGLLPMLSLVTEKSKRDAIEVIPENIPESLRTVNQWVAWKLVPRDGKMTKLPINVKTGTNASSTDPSTWATFDEALDYYHAHDVAGIGFVF